ncbi:MAG: hypothetical protein HC880_11145 [Bacteroidia bacterium]|nr:hypothetical protein [Bacteroidia bacterium]
MQKGEVVYELSSKPSSVEVNGRKIVKEDNTWKGYVAYLISDCLADATALIKELSFTEKSITNLITQYNTCKQEDFIVPKADQPWAKVKAGISIILAIFFSFKDIFSVCAGRH